jgi:Icc-related predicted phosphoesterase
MIIDCISDLHGHYPELEGGDLLIVAGDLTTNDKPYQYIEFGRWINRQNYKKRIVIGGNHDNVAQNAPPFIDTNNIDFYEWDYLCDSGTEFEGLKIWGSPWTKTFPNMNPKCKAFTCETEEELVQKWGLIPEDTDILITHSPPFGILDANMYGDFCGSKSLLITIAYIKPLISVFGHIHERGGKELVIPWKKNTTFVNASHVNERYQPVNKPIRIEL